MVDYKLTCSNRSRMHDSFALFQAPPDTNSPGSLISLAWLARPSAPNTRVTFSWQKQYHFIWGEYGQMHKGVVFDASQSVDADPVRENMIDLTKDNFGSPMFTNLRAGGPPGTLTVRQIDTQFDYPVLVGVGMADRAACAVQAFSNVTTTFIPRHDTYWLVFGSFIAGQVVDIQALSNPLKITFSQSVPVQTAILDMDNVIRCTSGQ